ncbi:hypothetical protein D3C85_1534230 [compost metagenome]
MSTGSAEKNATRLRPTSSTVPWVASGDKPATCGVRITLANDLNASGTRGSASKTSSAAPAIRRCSKALIRSAVTMTLARAMLTMKPLGPKASSTCLLIRCLVPRPPGVATIRKSEARASSVGVEQKL